LKVILLNLSFFMPKNNVSV